MSNEIGNEEETQEALRKQRAFAFVASDGTPAWINPNWSDNPAIGSSLYAAPFVSATIVRRAIADEAPFFMSLAEKVAWARGFNDSLEECRDLIIPEIYSSLYDWLQEREICPDSHEGMIEMDEVVEALNEHERQLLASPYAAPWIDLEQFREAVIDQFELVRVEETNTRNSLVRIAAAEKRRDQLLAVIDATQK